MSPSRCIRGGRPGACAASARWPVLPSPETLRHTHARDRSPRHGTTREVVDGPGPSTPPRQTVKRNPQVLSHASASKRHGSVQDSRSHPRSKAVRYSSAGRVFRCHARQIRGRRFAQGFATGFLVVSRRASGETSMRDGAVSPHTSTAYVVDIRDTLAHADDVS